MARSPALIRPTSCSRGHRPRRRSRSTARTHRRTPGGNTTVVLAGVLKNATGDFGKRLDINHITAASPLPLTDFTVQRGKYVSARCHDADKTWNPEDQVHLRQPGQHADGELVVDLQGQAVQPSSSSPSPAPPPPPSPPPPRVARGDSGRRNTSTRGAQGRPSHVSGHPPPARDRFRQRCARSPVPFSRHSSPSSSSRAGAAPEAESRVPG